MVAHGGNRVSDVKGALQLRRWAVSVLTGKVAADPGPQPERSWELFLEAERCAFPLVRRIQKRKQLGSLPFEFERRLKERAAVEAQRIESARRQLAAAADVGAELGCVVVVLKGAAAAMDPDDAVDLVDVDVLVEAQYAREFVALLDRRGYRPGGSSVAHLAARWNDEPLPIEVHTALDNLGRPLPDEFWSSLQTSQEFEGIHLLNPPDHLWHIVRHVGVFHPNRQAHIRELLLIGSAIGMRGQDLTAIENRISTSPDRATVEAVIRAAQELRDGTAHPDLLIEVPTFGYAVRRVLSRAPVPSSVAGHAHLWSLGFLMGPAFRRLLFSQIWYVTHDPSHARWLRKVERKFSMVGRPIRLVLRLIRFGISVTLAIPVAGIAALTTRSALNRG